MKVLLLLVHPNRSSFNHRMAGAAAEELTRLGHGVTLADLSTESFDGVAADPGRIAWERERLESHDLLLCQFPIWWFRPPALLLGWLEQVLDGAPWAGKRVLFSATAGGSPSTYEASGVSQEPAELFRPLLGALTQAGFTTLPSFVAWGLLKAGPTERAEHCEALRLHLRQWVNSLPEE